MNDSPPLPCADTVLEPGTNKTAVLVFRIHNARFGVNVAEVCEVLPSRSAVALPMAHPAVEGLIEVSELAVPLVNLERHLYGKTSPEGANDVFLLIESGAQYIAYRVHRVEQILHADCQDTLPAPQLGRKASPVKSIIRHHEMLLPLVDFECVATAIGIDFSHPHVASAPGSVADVRATRPIVFVDDSRTVWEKLRSALADAGFRNLHGFDDGAEAWDYVTQIADGVTSNSIAECVACIVTDSDMPRMDGLSLTRNVRLHHVLADVPVIVFSSVASPANEKNGYLVGATAQISKPNYAKVVETVAELLEAA